jgi:hypothetical protein
MINWKHTLGTTLVIAAGIDSYLASSQGTGIAATMHISSGVLGLAGVIILLLQNSITNPSATTLLGKKIEKS